MAFLKITAKQDMNLDLSIQFKNAASTFTFACSNSLLLHFFETNLSSQNTNEQKNLLSILANIFAHEIIKFFGTKIPGGLFEVVNVFFSNSTNPNDVCLDVELELNSNSENYYAQLYGSQLVIESISKHILDKTILTQINQLTGYPIYKGQLILDEKYSVQLLDKIRTVDQRQLFLKCTYLVENNQLDFYFPQSIVTYFCSLILKKTTPNHLPFNTSLGKVFNELFVDLLETEAHVYAKCIFSEVIYVKDKQLMEFSLTSTQKLNQFEFFCDVKNKMFILKLLQLLNFKPMEEISVVASGDASKPKLNNLNLPFSVEIGVSYLNINEYKSLSEGDIIVFDKTCLSTEATLVDKCVINLNGMHFIAKLNNGSCTVTHFTKDW